VIRVALFLVATALVCAERPRLNVLGIVLAANVDIPADGVGVLNGVKHLVIPAVFAFRMGYRPGQLLHARPLGLTFAGLFGLFALGAFRYSMIPGLQMLAYLAAAWLVAKGVMHADLAGVLDAAMIRRCVALVVLLGLVALVAEGGTNPFVGGRFTSFINAQQYAVATGALLALLWRAHVREPAQLNRLVGAAGLAAIVASGSRSALAGIVMGVAIAVLWQAELRPRLAPGTVGVAVLCFVALLGLASSAGSVGIRAFETVNALNGSEEVGTLAFRSSVYETALHAIGERDAAALAIGSGVGSAERVLMDRTIWIAPDVTIDPNRAMHNEWLRTLYELGLVGFAAFSAFVLGILTLSWRLAWTRGPIGWRAAGALVGLPLLLMFTFSENVLSGGLAGAGTAYSLLLGTMLAARHLDRGTVGVGGPVRAGSVVRQPAR